jgi:alanine dehydrogenase
MIIGIPKEVKADENRVAITPAGVVTLRDRGHTVMVETGAGLGSGIEDTKYRASGARVVKSAAELWARSEMVLKVKEPRPSEYRHLRPGLLLFTFLHLAAERSLARELVRRRVTALGYETIQLEDHVLPLLAPMSEVAGRMAVLAGAWCLHAAMGGCGMLLSGATGVKPAKVVIIGAGIAGANSCQAAAGMGADVTIVDRDPARLRYVHDILGSRVATLMSNRAAIEQELKDAQLVIGAVLIPGARAPRLISEQMLTSMQRGSVLVDLSIDQGGIAESSRPTTHHRPTYVHRGVVHYCVANMPAAMPHTATYALTNATLPYVLEIAERGVLEAGARNPAIRRGLNTFEGHVVHPAVAEALRTHPYSPWD